MDDPEIVAMSAVATALADLDVDARGRVLRWAVERYGSVDLVADAKRHDRTSSVSADSRNSAGAQHLAAEAMQGDSKSFDHFAELFAAAAPRSNDDKALVAAYWIQVHEGQEQWQARRVNAELRNVGHGISNITDALTGNITKKPQRVIQLKKSGNAKQANKTYKVTREGIVYIQGMLGAGKDLT